MSTSSHHRPAIAGIVCTYCSRLRSRSQVEPCCEREEHASRLVCADAHDCLGVVLGQLHESELAEPIPPRAPGPATPARRLCAHADIDGQGMHWLQPGETCPRAGEAERQARLTAASAVLGDYLRWTAGEIIQSRGVGDWEAWADRLSQHLAWVLGAVSR